MAITLNCSCGKTLKVDEKHRGKKAKCPECGNTLVVEEQEQETAVSEKPKKRVVVADDDDEGGGTAVKSGKPSRRADPDDDDDDDEPAKRKPIKKKAAKSNMMMYLIGGGCGGLLLLTCCSGIIGGAVWYFMFGSSGEDLKYIHEGNVGFVSFRVADIWKNSTVQDQLKNLPPQAKAEMDKKVKEMQEKGNMKIDDIERFTMIFRSFGDMMNPDIGMVMKTSRAMDRKKVVEATAKEANVKEKEVKHEGHTLYVFAKNGPDNLVMCFVSDRVVLMGPKEDTVKAMLNPNAKPAKNPALTRGIDMARSGKHYIVAAFEVKKDLVDKMGGGAAAGFGLNVDNLVKLNGVIVAASVVAKDLTGEAILTYENKDVAGKAKGEIDNMLGALKAKAGPPAVTKIMNSLKAEQSGADVSIKITANIDDLKGLMNPFGMGGFGAAGGGGGPIAGGGGGDPFGGGPVGGGGIQEAAKRTTGINNLKQIGLAMHIFHDTNKRFPNHAIRHPQTGQALLSWRVALLPYIEEGQLFKDIRLNEPWDSAHNKQFWNRMPRVYQLPIKPGDGKSTYYQVFHGNETVFPKAKGTAQNPMTGDISMASITDGTSNTIMVVEAATAVNWMAPDDIPFQMGDPALLGRVGNHYTNNTFLAGICDGTVRTVRRTVAPLTLQGAITRAGGEVVNID